MNKIHITYENLLGHKVRIVDEEYFVLHDIMVILERTREQSSWSGAKRKILEHMAYDPTPFVCELLLSSNLSAKPRLQTAPFLHCIILRLLHVPIQK